MVSAIFRVADTAQDRKIMITINDAIINATAWHKVVSGVRYMIAES